MLSQSQLAELEKTIDIATDMVSALPGNEDVFDYLHGYRDGLRRMLALVIDLKGESNE